MHNIVHNKKGEVIAVMPLITPAPSFWKPDLFYAYLEENKWTQQLEKCGGQENVWKPCAQCSSNVKEAGISCLCRKPLFSPPPPPHSIIQLSLFWLLIHAGSPALGIILFRIVGDR